MPRIPAARAALAALLALSATACAIASGGDARDPASEGEGYPAPDVDVVYIPTPERVVEVMMSLARVGPDDVMYDLGCGDGRLVIAAARRGARKAVGIDIDPERIREALDNARSEGVADRVTFVQGDLFELDFSDATVVTLYLLPELNLRLRPRLQALAPGSRVVSHSFDMGDWTPDETRYVDGKTVYAWTIPPRSAPGGSPQPPPAR